eukprot:COSAG05_NODE_105_length_18793_cov_115.346421_9_plen_52_part_00
MKSIEYNRTQRSICASLAHIRVHTVNKCAYSLRLVLCVCVYVCVCVYRLVH